MPSSKPLTVTELRKIWTNEFLPSIRREIKGEIEALSTAIKTLTDRCDAIEKSQGFISAKYDKVLQGLQLANKKSTELELNDKNQYDRIEKLERALYELECTVDQTQQYIRRDCLEITGIPVLPADNPKKLVKELGSLIGVELDDGCISAAHRLPDTKNVKNRLIVKFVRRDKREEVFKRRKNLVGKKSSNLPSVSAEMGKSIFREDKIHVNESLTSYRKRLFGRINKFKQDNNYKFLWTVNGKIHLRETETSIIEAFNTHEEFDDYLDQITNR